MFDAARCKDNEICATLRMVWSSGVMLDKLALGPIAVGAQSRKEESSVGCRASRSLSVVQIDIVFEVFWACAKESHSRKVCSRAERVEKCSGTN